jgi:hypothetical protein
MTQTAPAELNQARFWVGCVCLSQCATGLGESQPSSKP